MPDEDKLGELTLKVERLDVLIREGLIPRIDDHLSSDKGIHSDHETRVRRLESTGNQAAGSTKNTAKIWAGVNAVVTLAINAVFVVVSSRGTH